jgi:hypothetical protein
MSDVTHHARRTTARTKAHQDAEATRPRGRLRVLVPIIAIILLVSFVGLDKRHAAGSDALSAATAERIRPGRPVEVKDVSDPSLAEDGEQVSRACASPATAPAISMRPSSATPPPGARAWRRARHAASARAEGQGRDAPQAGGDFADLEIARAVVYMANKAAASSKTEGAAARPPASPRRRATARRPPAAAAAPPATVAPHPPRDGRPRPSRRTPPPPEPALYAQTCAVCHRAAGQCAGRWATRPPGRRAWRKA